MTASIDASPHGSALPEASTVTLQPVPGGWSLRLDVMPEIVVGHQQWWESSPLGRPVVATGAWQGDTFAADLSVITSPHRVRLTITSSTAIPAATAMWNTVPLTNLDLTVHLTAPLTTRSDVA